MLIKVILVVLFIAMLISLASALFFLVKDKGETKRTAMALTYRIAIAVSIFILLFVAYHTGLIQPHEIAG